MTLDDLKRINERINREPYVADPPGIDDWRPDACSYGKDCDSYAVAKLRELAAEGVPIADLLLAVVYVEPLAGDANRCHLILLVRQPNGWYALDNRKPFPVPVNELMSDRHGYAPFMVQKEGGSEEWEFWTGVQ